MIMAMAMAMAMAMTVAVAMAVAVAVAMADLHSVLKGVRPRQHEVRLDYGYDPLALADEGVPRLVRIAMASKA
jgi:hypothetical protein